MPYTIKLGPGSMRLDEVHAMLAASYWSPRIRKDLVAKAMGASVVVGAFDDATGTQVGYARVVTDHATFAWLCDVIVHEDHRDRGLATRMLDALDAVESLRGLRRWCLATRDAHGVYAKRGYVPVVPGAWMERKASPALWQDPA
jgi:GNAT superfamily N-acetyltransferase